MPSSVVKMRKICKPQTDEPFGVKYSRTPYGPCTQVAPSVWLGMHWRELRAEAVLTGVCLSVYVCGYVDVCVHVHVWVCVCMYVFMHFVCLM